MDGKNPLVPRIGKPLPLSEEQTLCNLTDAGRSPIHCHLHFFISSAAVQTLPCMFHNSSAIYVKLNMCFLSISSAADSGHFHTALTSQDLHITLLLYHVGLGGCSRHLVVAIKKSSIVPRSYRLTKRSVMEWRPTETLEGFVSLLHKINWMSINEKCRL